MNKDFWKRIDKLEELANKVEVKDWVYSAGFGKPAIIAENDYHGVQIAEAVFGGKASDIEYIAAANPAVILALIKKIEEDKATIDTMREDAEIQLQVRQTFYKFLFQLREILEIKDAKNVLSLKLQDLFDAIMDKVKELVRQAKSQARPRSKRP